MIWQKKATKSFKNAFSSDENPKNFGAGLFSVKGNITGYGEGYIGETGEVCINVGLIVKVGGEKKFTNYYFITVVPFYVTFGGGVEATASGSISLAVDIDNGLSINGGTLEFKLEPYLKLEGGVGADGLLSIGAYGKGTIETLIRFSDSYKNVTLNGNIKVKATALCWSKVLAELDGDYVIYDSNKAKSYSLARSLLSASYYDMSDAELISMDYLEEREAAQSRSTYSLRRSATASTEVLSYAYENASPMLLQVGDDLYLFYLDGVADREAQNQTALFYMKSSDGGSSWDEAVRVDAGANETADYEYDVMTVDDKIYVLWSEENTIYGDEILTMDSQESIEQMAADLDLMMAVIDCADESIETLSLGTELADMKPQLAVGADGTVYAAWLTNDLSSEDGMFSSDNGFALNYASSADNFATVTSCALSTGYYPLTVDIGIMGTDVYAALDVDVDADLDTQEDREIYLLDLQNGGSFTAFTENEVTDSVPVFSSVGGSSCLLWYQDGNIAYTSDGETVSYVFDSENLPTMGQEFSVLAGTDGKAAIVWTSTSLEDDGGVELYCTDFDGTEWSSAYVLQELESEYTTVLSGYLDGSDYVATYLGTVYSDEDTVSTIRMLNVEERADTEVSYTTDAEEAVGSTYPITFVVTNTGNLAVSQIQVTSSDGTIEDTLDVDIAPGETAEILYEGIMLPTDFTEPYSCELTVAADGETDTSDNEISLYLGAPELAVEAALDFSGGRDLASVSMTNNGLVETDIQLEVFTDEDHETMVYSEVFASVAPEEIRTTVLDLAVLDETAETFYFAVSDVNDLETADANNESLLYLGKGMGNEYTDGESPQATGISLSKTQTVYEYGETITADDLTVTLNYDDGDSVQVFAYSTNVDELDTDSLGERTLSVSYGDFTAQLTLSVEAKVLDDDALLVLPQASYTYNGTEWTPEPEVTVGGQTLTAGSDYTVTYSNNVHVGTAQVEITGCGNYQGTIVGSFEILKAAAPKLEGEFIYSNKDKARNNVEVDFQDLISEYGTLTGLELSIEENTTASEDSVISSAMIEDQTLLFSINAGTEGDYALITVQFSFEDYEDAEWTVTVTLIEKEGVQISGISASDRSYDGKVYTFDGSAVLTAEDGTDLTDEITLEYLYSGTMADGEVYASTTQAPADAGSYVLTVSVPDDNDEYAGTAEYYFEIIPVPLTLTVQDKNLRWGDEIPDSYDYSVEGLLGSETLITEPSFNCAVTDTSITAVYTISPYGADAGSNYEITYVSGTLRVSEELIGYQVTFDVQGHGEAPDTYIGIKSGSTIVEPEDPDIVGSYIFAGWYKDADCSQAWDFANDIVESDMILYADWRIQAEADSTLSIREITDLTYTGSALKPAVRVYDGDTLLKAGTDYTVTYKNNTNANVNANAGGIGSALDDTAGGFDKSLPYVKIVGKGNYTAELYVNFNILPKSIGDGESIADSITLQYNDQLVTNAKKAQSAFTSIKYKKTMKAGTDYLLTLTDESGNTMDSAKVPAGGSGVYTLTVEGTGNYTGSIERSIYVSEKTALLKNATVTLGKNVKTMSYTGTAIKLTSAYYDSATKKYYTEDSDESLTNVNEVFVVKMGSTGLVCGEDYTVSYTNNTAVGTATLTITGIGRYMGSKSVTFKIKGTTLNTRNVTVEAPADAVYDGSAITQNGLSLVYKDGTAEGKLLVYGEDYLVSYKNNVQKGTARMTFTMLESAGYTGSITKTFRISAANLADENAEVQIDIEAAVYSKSGAKPGVTVTYNGRQLTAGTDYSVSYRNNAKVTVDDKNMPSVTLKGKGNYTGTLSEEFEVSARDLSDVTVEAIYIAYSEGRKDSYAYKPKLTVKEGSSTLRVGTDYYITEYCNNTQADVTKYLNAIQNGASAAELEEMRPYVVLSGGKNGYYTGTIEYDLPVYVTKLSTSNLYINVESAGYTGSAAVPDVTIYYCETRSILAAAKKGDFTDAVKLEEGVDYQLTSTSVKAGKNSGTVKISGIAPKWGGSVSQRFTISSKTITWR